MALTDIKIRKAKVSNKQFKYFDRDGLYLLIKPSGSKIWRFKYSFAGKEKLLTLGKYPEINLIKARELLFEARKLISDGVDPSSKKREEKQLAIYKSENTFKTIALQWHETNKHKWTNEHAQAILNKMQTYLFHKIGNRPIDSFKPLDILDLLKKVESQGKIHTTHKLLSYAQNIFRFAVITGRIDYNPARELQVAIKPIRHQHFPTIKVTELKTFLEKLETVQTAAQNKLAVKLQLATFLRTNELRQTKWKYIDFKNKQWVVPNELMKMKQAHIVPISEYTFSLLKELEKINGNYEYIFPNRQGKRHPFMSENTINYVIELAGYKGKLVGHGFRSLASTTLNEHGFNKDAIERQLAHKEPNKIRAAYNFAEYINERIEMMEWWGKFVANKGIIE